MSSAIVPRDVKRALELLQADPTRPWNIEKLALACGVAPRTLQKHFRRFVGRTPLAFLRDLRVELARKELLRASRQTRVAETATRCGFFHLGRFAMRYSDRYGESPSSTLRRRHETVTSSRASFWPVPNAIERPTVAVIPFERNGANAGRTAGVTEEIAAALAQLRWIQVVLPDRARYQVRGKISDDGSGELRITAFLLDAAAGRYLWADHYNGGFGDALAFEERIIRRITRSIEQSLRAAEIDRSWRKEPEQLNAWELTMRALSSALSLEPAAQGVALEWLEQAMELTQRDPLPAALAAWCHGLRAGHHFISRPDNERMLAQSLADRAARLSTGDPLTETILAAGYTLAHDLSAANVHVERALVLDGGSAWAWGRSGWVRAYGGLAEDAIERFKIARALAPADPLNFLCAIGIGAAHFEAARYKQAVRWFERGLAEHPTAVWNNRFLVPAYVLAGQMEDARQSLAEFAQTYPDLTIAEVRNGLPYSASFLDRVAEGLERVGMPIS